MKIALVGAGYMAREHARAFAAVEGVSIVGVHSRTRSRAAEVAQHFGARVFDDIASMYGETRADGVVVAVSEMSMLSVGRQVFQHPWACLLEKPVGIDLAEARAIQSAADSGRARAFVAFNRRSYSSTRQALAELSAEQGPRLISVLDQQDMASALASGAPERVVENYMYANSIHLVDYFTLFGRGRVVSVQCPIPWTPGSPRTVVSVVCFDSGDVGIYQATWDGPGPWAVAVTSAQTRVELRPLENLSIQRRGERHAVRVEPDPVDVMFKPGLHRQAEQFLLAARGEVSALASLEDSTRSMLLCSQIYGLTE